jgi:hypothetical protein
MPRVWANGEDPLLGGTGVLQGSRRVDPPTPRNGYQALGGSRGHLLCSVPRTDFDLARLGLLDHRDP